MTFDPYHLTPTASLNRVRIVDLPGVDLDPQVRGKTGWDLLSAPALSGILRDHAAALDLDPALDDGELRGEFFTRYDDLPAAGVAAVARRMGRNLGWLLLALRRGDAVNRAARDEWHFSYWEHWATVRNVWIGGGIGEGVFGAALCDHAREVFTEHNLTDTTMQPSPYGMYLPLMGLARRVPVDCRAALVLDFGQTRVKRACAVYRDGALIALDPLPSDLMPWTFIFPAGIDPTEGAQNLLAWMVDVVVEGWTTATQMHNLCVSVPLSIAAYVRDGQPLDTQRGPYVRLAQITDHTAGALSEALGDALGVPVTVLLEHDGTAAATAHAGTPHSAVITFGTALGIGFPRPDDSDLRAVRFD